MSGEPEQNNDASTDPKDERGCPQCSSFKIWLKPPSDQMEDAWALKCRACGHDWTVQRGSSTM